MTSDQFDTLVQQLETYARSHPKQYKWRVGWLAALGYAYFVLLFVLLIGSLVALQVMGSKYTALSSLDLNSITAIVCVFAIAMLGINLSRPKGLYLTRSQAPKLYVLIDELTAKLNTVKFHQVIINYEVNAGVLQLPRVGILGWETNYLFLGLPLMQALSPDQFHAVLIHELAHLSSHDSRFSNWIYRLRYRWLQVQPTLLLHPLLKWYVPFFNAYSFVLARANEYAADRSAAMLVGQEVKAHALIQLHLTEALLRQYFWQNLILQARSQPEPPTDIISRQLQLIQTGASSREAAAWLALDLTQNTNNEDTHPCLRERVAALGCHPTLPSVSEISAAAYFLGDKLAVIATELDSQWQTENRTWWLNLYLRSQREQTQLEVLTHKANRQPLSVSDQWQQARLTLPIHGKNKAIPLLQTLLDQEPYHLIANFMLGKLLVEAGDIGGIHYLETAMKRDPLYIPDCCELAYIFLQKQGDQSTAQPYLERLRAYTDQCQKAAKERRKIEAGDSFLPHDFSSTELGELALQLANYPEIQAAYLVRKAVTHFPDRPLYVLAIFRRFWRSPDGSFYDYDHLGQILQDELTFSQQREWVIEILGESNDSLGKAIRKIKHATIYQYQP